MIRSPEGQFVAGVHAYREPQPHWERDWLHIEYVVNGRSAGDIAKQIGCTDANILYWLGKHAISRRTVAEARKLKRWAAVGSSNGMFGRLGPLNPRYIDGTSPERQRLFSQSQGRGFRLRIFWRDDFKCVRCRAPKLGPRSLHAHHVKPWANNPELRFDETNVVTLCRGCHLWVHSKKNTSGEFLA